ncbi:hypothetical protein L1D14_10750 [Vibrio tubiashii]|uniref:hypothetical protein n=1 Tax=Vibrio tubiashii TaxID=29498 RepID=UPI001EFCDC9F|nr:hypothetical protein [Vibrio tubiashii]MCG9576717.1 hypothetical protein [Vibrio tubiashii]
MIDLSVLESYATKIGVDYVSTRLPKRKQIDLLREWILLTDVAPLLDICSLKLCDQRDKAFKAFWSDIYQEVNMGKKPTSLFRYLDKQAANVILAGIESDTTKKALKIALEGYDQGSNLVLELHKRAVAPYIYIGIAAALCTINQQGYDDTLTRISFYQFPVVAQWGYVLNEFILEFGVYVLAIFLMLNALLVLALNNWVDPKRLKAAHTVFFFKVYRYHFASEFFKQILMLRSSNLPIHDVLPAIREASSKYGVAICKAVEKKTKTGVSPYSAICEVGLLDESDIKLVKDTIAHSSDSEDQVLQSMVETYELKYERSLKVGGIVLIASAYVVLASIFILTFGGQYMAQFSAVQATMLGG